MCPSPCEATFLFFVQNNCVYPLEVCFYVCAFKVTIRAVVSQRREPDEQRHSMSAEPPSVAMTHLRECDHQRQQPPLPASRPDTHTYTHRQTARHIYTLLMECGDTPAPLIFLSSVTLEDAQEEEGAD